MEHRLAGSGAYVHDHTVIVQASACGGICDEVEHRLRLVGRTLGDLAEGLDVPLGDDEEVRRRARRDVGSRRRREPAT
jgi:hypothetical protein